jgi:hypothetical protein
MSRFAKFVPSRRWLIVPPNLIGIAVVGVLARSKKPLARLEPTELATQLVVQRVYRQAVPAVATGHGTAKPVRTWSAIAEVGGRIVEMRRNLRSGISIQEGEMLLVIDPTDYELQVRQRKSDRLQAESELEQLRLNETAD